MLNNFKAIGRKNMKPKFKKKAVNEIQKQVWCILKLLVYL